MLYFFIAIILSIIFTFAARRLALFLNIVDTPDDERKKHGRPVPLLGGIAIFSVFWVMIGYIFCFTNLFGRNLSVDKLFWVFIGSLILMAVGYFDDKYSLPVLPRLALSAFAVFIVIAGGVGLEKITNPFGGIFYLDFIRLGNWLVFADIIVFFWILGMIYTVKILDGLDGLATGITAIGALMIYFIANGERWHQPDVALLALIFAGACLGFLIFNFYPAKIFLGEGGGLFLGFILGVLSVIAGGKIATALLVMAIPIFDLARVVYLRFRRGKPVGRGDREHLHFRLLDLGFGHRKTVVALYAFAFVFGTTTLFFQSAQKLFALIFLGLLMLVFGIWIEKKQKIKNI
ncbi:MAG: MraY family glycosyltransferase [Patescibacteria group bacterium]|nr:MraY family glycosyltransferase [Patescibacteria group bacterium]